MLAKSGRNATEVDLLSALDERTVVVQQQAEKDEKTVTNAASDLLKVQMMRQAFDGGGSAGDQHQRAETSSILSWLDAYFTESILAFWRTLPFSPWHEVYRTTRGRWAWPKDVHPILLDWMRFVKNRFVKNSGLSEQTSGFSDESTSRAQQLEAPGADGTPRSFGGRDEFRPHQQHDASAAVQQLVIAPLRESPWRACAAG